MDWPGRNTHITQALFEVTGCVPIWSILRNSLCLLSVSCPRQDPLPQMTSARAILEV
jgi:hypothetical protein